MSDDDEIYDVLLRMIEEAERFLFWEVRGVVSIPLVYPPRPGDLLGVVYAPAMVKAGYPVDRQWWSVN